MRLADVQAAVSRVSDPLEVVFVTSMVRREERSSPGKERELGPHWKAVAYYGEQNVPVP